MAGMSIAAVNRPSKDTEHWWKHVQTLAADNMEGRDTGSQGYQRAARYVEAQLERAGLKAAGENGYRQTVPLRDLTVDAGQSRIELVRAGVARGLALNQEVSVTPRVGMPVSLDAGLVFGGYGNEDGELAVKDKVVVVFSGTPADLPAADRAQFAADRGRRLARLGVAGVMTIDNPKALETPRWPVAYSRAVSIAGAEARGGAGAGMTMRLNASAAGLFLEGSGHSWDEILNLGAAGKPLPHFALTGTLRATLRLTESRTSSDNLIAVLPGAEGPLSGGYVLVSAHLDGYGIGEPVAGDRIYNGAFDDAACVANLLELAADLHTSGRKLRRSLLFAVYTGEEKGLLGSNYFVSHLTVPKDKIVANINLDYIRPIFPLKILTTLGLEDSTLGETAREVAGSMGIRVQTDNEPERGLYRRSDQFNFIRNGVPGIAFIFGYENGSREEGIYRAWYRERYHKPQDDLQQPVDFEAAARFQQFFNKLTEAVANADQRPRWHAGSAYAPKVGQ